MVYWLLSRAIFDKTVMPTTVRSPHNQRIEGWWSFYSKNRSSWWINIFQDLEAEGKIGMTSEMNKECLWYCFSGMLQADCNAVKEHWNTHYIRQSRHNTVKGRPDSLFFCQNITVLWTIFCQVWNPVKLSVGHNKSLSSKIVMNIKNILTTFFSNSLIIHQVKTKKIISVKEVWIPGLN